MLASNWFRWFIICISLIVMQVWFYPITFGSYNLCTWFSSHTYLLMDLDELMSKFTMEARFMEKNNHMGHALKSFLKSNLVLPRIHCDAPINRRLVWLVEAISSEWSMSFLSSFTLFSKPSSNHNPIIVSLMLLSPSPSASSLIFFLLILSKPRRTR